MGIAEDRHHHLITFFDCPVEVLEGCIDSPNSRKVPISKFHERHVPSSASALHPAFLVRTSSQHVHLLSYSYKLLASNSARCVNLEFSARCMSVYDQRFVGAAEAACLLRAWTVSSRAAWVIGSSGLSAFAARNSLSPLSRSPAWHSIIPSFLKRSAFAAQSPQAAIASFICWIAAGQS